MKTSCKPNCKPDCSTCKPNCKPKGGHFHTHKEKYMFAGVLAGALAHTVAGVTFKAFLLMVLSALPFVG